MKKFILPLAAGFVLGVSGVAMAGSLEADTGTITARNDTAVVATAKATGPQLLTNAQMDGIVAGVTTRAPFDNYVQGPSSNTTVYCVPSDTGQNHGFSNGGYAGRNYNGAYSGYYNC